MKFFIELLKRILLKALNSKESDYYTSKEALEVLKQMALKVPDVRPKGVGWELGNE